MNTDTASVPVCSVCIANYNGAGILRACLESVQAQDCGFTVEIIVHDDASTDGSDQIVERDFPAVRLIRSQENVGFCVANNRMAAVARGDYILLLNNDTELFPDALRALRDAANSGSPCILGLPQYDAATGLLIDRGSLLDPFFNPVPNLDPGLREVGMVIGACLWIPRPTWQQLGGFPEWFGSIGEDLYLCSRARLQGVPVRVLSSSGYRHWVGHSFGGGKLTRQHGVQTSIRRRKFSERNKTYVMVLCTPISVLWILLPLHLALLLAEGLTLSLVTWNRTLWSLIYRPVIPEIFANRAKILGLRSEIQELRKIELGDWLRPFKLFPRKLSLLFKHGRPAFEH